MSKNLSPRDDEMKVIAELANLLGGMEAVHAERDYEEEYVQCVINRVRGLLMEAIKIEGIKPSELADRLGVDRSQVTRFFRSGRDMKVSTLAIIARALNRKWIIELADVREQCLGNARPEPIAPDVWEAQVVRDSNPLQLTINAWAVQ